MLGCFELFLLKLKTISKMLKLKTFIDFESLISNFLYLILVLYIYIIILYNSTEDYSNAYMDLVNGPMDHGWCMGYTCQLRLSLFPMMLPVGKYLIITYVFFVLRPGLLVRTPQ